MKLDPCKLGRPSMGHAEMPPQGKLCDHPDCRHAGEYRAPRSRALNDYYWFCLSHVRDYNRAWNYCEGMSSDEIEDQIRLDTVWGRPTWRLAAGGLPHGSDAERLREGFGVFGRDWADCDAARRPRQPPHGADNREDTAMRAMDLLHPLTVEGLKARYKELVKRFHPDTHGGDTATEEKLKTIIEAYKTLIGSLTQAP